MIKTCPWCGKTFDANTAQQIYCSDYCKRKLWEHNHKGNRKPRPYIPVERADLDPIRKCPKDCRYRGEAGGMQICNYLLHPENPTREPRGCKGGKDCKRYKK